MRTAVLLAISLWGFASLAGASEEAVWEPSVKDPVVWPAWFGPVKVENGGLMESWEAVIGAPPRPGDSLAITVVYQDGGGILRAVWNAPTGDITLAGNLLEGVAMTNRRTLLIRDAEILSGGKLILQSDETGRILRVAAEWLGSREVLSRSGAETPFLWTSAGGISRGEAWGNPPEASQDERHARASSAVIQDAPLALDDAIAFALTLESLPVMSLLVMDVADLPPDVHLEVWVNGSNAGPLALEVPDLWNPGWVDDGSGGKFFAGWRRGGICLPAKFLAAGENTFQLLRSDGVATGPVVRRVRLQTEFSPLAYLPATEESSSATTTDTPIIPNP